ncbi:Chitinase 4 [Umbelopsis nana]
MNPTPAANGPVIAGYFVNWGIYDRKHNVVDLKQDAHKLTHVLYGFANLKEDGEVFLGDAWADTDKHFPAEETVDGRGDTWTDEPNNLYGNFKQLLLLKHANRHLKVSLSIGGWSWSTNFAVVAADPQRRARFVETSVKLVADLGLDGIDIDWEFPKDDKEAFNYIHLLYEVRIALDKYAQSQNQLSEPRFLLTCAVPCSPAQYQILRLAEMHPYVDFFYLMAYDYAGSWDSVAGHQAALYGGAFNTHQAVDHYLRQGVPPSKVVMGMPAYGRGFSNTNGIGEPFSGVPEGTWDQGVFDYKQLPKPGAVEYHDKQRVASWSQDPQTREIVTYDTPQVIEAKCRYVQEKHLAGAMFWELSADHKGDHPRSLVNTVYRTFGGRVDQMPNHLVYHASKYVNVRSDITQ